MYAKSISEKSARYWCRWLEIINKLKFKNKNPKRKEEGKGERERIIYTL